MKTIAVDLSGSDLGPEEVYEGVRIAISEDTSLRVIPVGPERLVNRLVNQFGTVLISPKPTEVVSLPDGTLRDALRKYNSSAAIAIRLVAEGVADAALSFGDTKAATFWASLDPGRGGLGLIDGVLRPPLALTMPTYECGRAVLLDTGANVDCTAEMLVQFARLGRIMAQVALGVNEPRVGLLSNGEEDTKGNALSKEAFGLLKTSNFPGFVGNVQLTDVVKGGKNAAHVVVTDGFPGNTGFKGIEAGVRLGSESLRRNMKMNWRTKLGYLLAKPAFDQVKAELDSSQFGSMPLLGTRLGLVMIGHGSADRVTVSNGIKSAARFVGLGLAEKIEASFSQG